MLGGLNLLPSASPLGAGPSGRTDNVDSAGPLRIAASTPGELTLTSPLTAVVSRRHSRISARKKAKALS